MQETYSIDWQAPPLLTIDQAIAGHIRLALDHTCGKIEGINGAAELLQMNPNTLQFRMKKVGIRSKRI
jgi:hypothetical protein